MGMGPPSLPVRTRSHRLGAHRGEISVASPLRIQKVGANSSCCPDHLHGPASTGPSSEHADSITRVAPDQRHRVAAIVNAASSAAIITAIAATAQGLAAQAASVSCGGMPSFLRQGRGTLTRGRRCILLGILSYKVNSFPIVECASRIVGHQQLRVQSSCPSRWCQRRDPDDAPLYHQSAAAAVFIHDSNRLADTTKQ